jgi:hypothetical protein
MVESSGRREPFCERTEARRRSNEPDVGSSVLDFRCDVREIGFHDLDFRCEVPESRSS